MYWRIKLFYTKILFIVIQINQSKFSLFQTTRNICPDFKWLCRDMICAQSTSNKSKHVGLPDSRCHSKSSPFATQPLLDHSKSRLGRISDPHCIYFLPYGENFWPSVFYLFSLLVPVLRTCLLMTYIVQ